MHRSLTINVKTLLFFAALAIAGLGLTACGSEKTAEQKVSAQIAKVYALNADERAMAQTNAKQFYEREWPIDNHGGKSRGVWIECRPSDSNANGLVSCAGKVPQIGGSFADVKRYCGYRPDLVGCSDEDTVK